MIVLLSKYLPALVMIISVPRAWNSRHNSPHNNSAVTLCVDGRLFEIRQTFSLQLSVDGSDLMDWSWWATSSPSSTKSSTDEKRRGDLIKFDTEKARALIERPTLCCWSLDISNTNREKKRSSQKAKNLLSELSIFMRYLEQWQLIQQWGDKFVFRLVSDCALNWSEDWCVNWPLYWLSVAIVFFHTVSILWKIRNTL